MMADCNVFEPLLHCVLDGEATAEERARVMKHLAECPACREKFQQLTELHMAFTELDAEVPADLADKVMETVRAEGAKERRGRIRHWRSGLLAAAACCAGVFVGVWGMNGGDVAMNNAAGQRATAEESMVYQAADDSAAVEMYSYALTDAADSVTAQSGNSAADGKMAADLPAAEEEQSAAVVLTEEPAVGQWLGLNFAGETENVALTAEEAEELSAWLAEQGIDLMLPEGEPVILTYVE